MRAAKALRLWADGGIVLSDGDTIDFKIDAAKYEILEVTVAGRRK